ncbi:hypothetical protein [Noviherbaspirillum sedimenti]|uniref:Uncharacterized protein n=1 Tax=Noviherbaspirillum sedimenti TaxID=2320865 RepID=A0A3A3G2G6_9BURK|nr:hypothetical protein [Noviherbaspirillum sedimenti]RJG00672.1 hypothetical protein D3878_02970 [Noviherbaspirillum sedimenti]
MEIPTIAALTERPPHVSSILVKREVRVFLGKWISRIPEFRIKPETKTQQSVGMASQVSELRLSWELSK